MNCLVILFVIAFCGTCTTNPINELNRITGGFPASDDTFPYMVSLQRKSEVHLYTRGHICGGALVTLRHAVTAASCIYNNGVQINPNDYRVFAGAANLTNDASPDRVRDISNFIVHPDYRPNTPFVNDIAIIRFVNEFSSNAVKPVPLSTAQTDSSNEQGACVSSGWGGQNETSSVSTELMYLSKTVFPQPTCANLDLSQEIENPVTITDSMMCAMQFRIYASCEGDNGNPLVCHENLNGVLIRTKSCIAHEGTPAEVYTRVSSFRPWITRVTSGVSTFQPGMAVLAMITVVRIITANVLN